MAPKPLGAPTPTRAGALLALTTLIALAIALPFVLRAFGLDFYLSLASRIVVYAIAATSLNLVLGYAGLVSFGHAAFFGLGAYVTGVMISEGVQSGPLHLAATIAVTALAAFVIGAILVGAVDTLGRTLLQHVLREFLPPQWASAAGPAIASIAVYVFMAIVLAIKPQGLFPART